MITTIPTQTEGAGQLGQVKTDAGAYTSAATQVPAAQWNAVVDNLIKAMTAIGLDSGLTPSSLRALDANHESRLVTLESAPAGGPLWKWNETDTSEFTAYLDQIGGGGVALTRVAGAAGPRLRVTFPTKVTGEKLTVIGINALSLPIVQTDCRRYRLRFRLVGSSLVASAASSQWYALGASVLSNKGSGAAHFSQFLLTQFSTATRFGKVTAGVVATSGGTPPWTSSISNLISADDLRLIVPFNIEIAQRHASGVTPTWRGTPQASVPGTSPQIYGCASSAYLEADVGALAGGWSTANLDTCGIAILGSTGTSAGQWFEFDSIRVEDL